jgi:asparagine synthase (glutamine-hydrolysing)
MSVIFGVLDRSGSAAAQESLERWAQITVRYGPDGTSVCGNGPIGMAYQAFCTHRRSSLEHQPTIDKLGNMVVFDGRLDNYQELCDAFGISASVHSDSELILKAFERWSQGCFSHFVGEWAMAIWATHDRTLYLARDHSGSRTLFYRDAGGHITWSTYLETFFADQASLELNPEYFARVLSCHAKGELTPYKDVQGVPPAHYIAIREGRVTIRPHWNWIADSQIIYRTDSEYDEHFLHLFGQAVKRRMGGGARILAELSGGMDSSSIVCMADKLVSDESGATERLDTVSYYDETEPDWDDRPFFEAVEEYRHKKGFHIDLSSLVPRYELMVLPNRFYPYLCGDSNYLEMATQFEQAVGSGRYRVILSGIGGDELLGGIPIAMPELADYLRQGRLNKLLTRAFAWCLAGRQPLLPMLYSTFKSTVDLYRGPSVHSDSIPSWLRVELRKLSSRPLMRLGENRGILCARPSAIANGRMWWSVLETLPNQSPGLLGCYEYRFPYLDRDLVDFLHRVPREQLVQPGRRRLLMRRAVKEIVPAAVLERKRKGFISHGPLSGLRDVQERIETLFTDPLVAKYGFIDQREFCSALHTELVGGIKWISHITKAIDVELWLQRLRAQQPSLRSSAVNCSEMNHVQPGGNRASGIRKGSAGT